MASPFAAPIVDMSALGRLPDAYAQGQEWRQGQNVRAARKDALSSLFANGDADYETAMKKLFAAGDFEGGMQMGKLASEGAISPVDMIRLQQGQQRIDIARQNAGSKAPVTRKGFDESGREIVQQWDPNARAWTQVGGAKSGGTSLTVADKKAILEADEGVQSGESVITSLDKALELNDRAYTGPAAETRGYVGSLFGLEDAAATEELKNIVTAQALDSLRATFGSMPTEGERKILLEVQGSVNQSPAVRKKIYERAKAAAQKRLAFNRQRGESLRSGTFYQPGYEASPQAPSQYQEGQTATNPQTGQKIQYRNGQWVPMQ
jgi:hypothetical protein